MSDDVSDKPIDEDLAEDELGDDFDDGGEVEDLTDDAGVSGDKDDEDDEADEAAAGAGPGPDGRTRRTPGHRTPLSALLPAHTGQDGGRDRGVRPLRRPDLLSWRFRRWRTA